MSLVDYDTGKIGTALTIPRPHEVVSAVELCESIESALPLVDDPTELLDGRAKLLAVEQYLSRTTKVGRARMEATARRIEMRVGEVLGGAEHVPGPGRGHKGSRAQDPFSLNKRETYRLRLLAQHPAVVEQVIADHIDDATPPSQRKVLDAIRDHIAKEKEEAVRTWVPVGDRVQQIKEGVALGLAADRIAELLGIDVSRVRQIASEHNIVISLADKSPAAEKERVKIIRREADRGATSHQIAAEIGVSAERVRRIAKRNGIDIPGDTVVGKRQRIDPYRVIENTATALEGLVMGVAQIDVSTVDLSQVPDWVPTSMRESLKALKRFMEEINP